MNDPHSHKIWAELNIGGAHKRGKLGPELAELLVDLNPDAATYWFYRDGDELCISVGLLFDGASWPLLGFKERITRLATAMGEDCIPIYFPATGEGWLVGRNVGPWQPFRLEKFQRAPQPDDECEDI